MSAYNKTCMDKSLIIYQLKKIPYQPSLSVPQRLLQPEQHREGRRGQLQRGRPHLQPGRSRAKQQGARAQDVLTSISSTAYTHSTST